MSFSYTETESFTRTHAKYLASKVAADLLQMQQFYGGPSDKEIEDYIIELTEFLAGGFLDSIEYGFQQEGKWVVVISYTVENGILQTDNRSGRIPVGVDVSKAYFNSYRRPSQKWWNLSEEERQKISDPIPVKRVPRDEPGFVAGNWTQDKSYSAGGTTMQRKVFRPL